MAEKTSSVIPTISGRHWATVDSDELMPAGRLLNLATSIEARPDGERPRGLLARFKTWLNGPRLRRAVRSSPTVACRRAAYACGVWPQLTKEPRVAATAPGAERASGLTTPVPKPGPANELSATPTQLWPFGVGLADTSAGAAITATAVITPKRSVRILASDLGYHFVVAEATCLPDATKGGG